MKQRLRLNIDAPSPLGQLSTDVAMARLIREITTHTNRGLVISSITAEIELITTEGVAPAETGTRTFDGNTQVYIPDKSEMFKNWIDSTILRSVRVTDDVIEDLIQDLEITGEREFGIDFSDVDLTPDTVNYIMSEFGLPYKFTKHSDGMWSIG